MENNLHSASGMLTNLIKLPSEEQVNKGIELANNTVNVVSKASQLIGSAIEWSDKASTQAADTEKIKSILNFVKKEESVLV